jgi:hypothetical protein
VKGKEVVRRQGCVRRRGGEELTKGRDEVKRERNEKRNFMGNASDRIL